jgi:alpha-tubulin suppressor-like RCC1 family protein
LWGWGWNGEGELGNGEIAQESQPSAVMDDVKQVTAGKTHTLILKTDGSVWGCGDNILGLYWGSKEAGQYLTPIKLADDAVSIAAEYGRSYYIKSDGTLWGWGLQVLGDGSEEDQYAPVQIPLDGPSFG